MTNQEKKPFLIPSICQLGPDTIAAKPTYQTSEGATPPSLTDGGPS